MSPPGSGPLAATAPRTGVARRGQAPDERRQFEKKGSGRDDRGQQVEGRRAVRELLVAGRRKVHELLALGRRRRRARARRARGARARGAACASSRCRPTRSSAGPAPTRPRACRVRGAGAGRRPRRAARRSGRVPRRARRRHRPAEPRRGHAHRGDRGRHRRVLATHRAVGLTPAVAKAAAGALEHLPVAFVSGIPGALERAKRAGVWCVGLDADGDQSLFDLVGRRRTARARARRRRAAGSRGSRARVATWSRRSRCTVTSSRST